jgi:hypothetical protein
MQDDKTKHLKISEPGYWPTNQVSILLIIALLILGCGYMISSFIQLLDTL